MKLTEAKLLRPGDKVVWPEGANGARGADGVVVAETPYYSQHIEWSDGEYTFTDDEHAMPFVVKSNA